jgi:hypothetical protein
VAELDADGRRFPHQFLIHTDLCADRLSIAYSYPFSSPPLRERRIGVTGPPDIALILERIRGDCLSVFEVPARSARVPHAMVPSTLRLGCLTVVLQDYRRDLPVARLYVDENLLGERVEHEIHMARDEFPHGTLIALERLKSWAKGVVWQDHENRFGEFFR